ncbi:CUB and sushi domain-containing protein 3-like 1, partial [Homarus americanus]
ISEAAVCNSTTRLQPGDEVVFQSENYPNQYPNNHTCEWFFKTDADKTLTLECDPFSTQMPRDKLRLFQPTSTNYQNNLAQISGDVECFMAVSSTNEVRAIFKTNDLVTSTGFSCTVSVTEAAVCNSTTRLQPGDEVVFQSENYPNQYPNNHACDWIFETDADETLTIECESFSTEMTLDKLKFFQPTETALQKKLAYASGNLRKFMTTSSSNSVRALFKTDGSVTSTGFSCTAPWTRYKTTLEAYVFKKQQAEVVVYLFLPLTHLLPY